MSSNGLPAFVRAPGRVLEERLSEPRRFIQVVAGPRQVGKTTLVRQVLAGWESRARYASADEPSLRDRGWIAAQWEAARAEASGARSAVLALDEIHKIPGWSETVKRLWDEDTAGALPLHVILSGSTPLLLQHGLTESLAGRFELILLGHWSFTEMHEVFGVTLDEFVYFGGYPGAAPLASDLDRWMRYVRDALVETTVARDVLLLNRVDKPALLRQLFDLACRYSGQILSYNKMLGQLQDAGNTTTLAHYLELLAAAGMVRGIEKYSGSFVRQRASSPKLQVLNNALMTVSSGRTLVSAREDSEYWGRLVESAVGTHLANAASAGLCDLWYWRGGNLEVDFVVAAGEDLLAIEVKSGRRSKSVRGLSAFADEFPDARALIVGQGGVGIGEFLESDVRRWLRGLNGK